MGGWSSPGHSSFGSEEVGVVLALLQIIIYRDSFYTPGGQEFQSAVIFLLIEAVKKIA